MTSTGHEAANLNRGGLLAMPEDSQRDTNRDIETRVALLEVRFGHYADREWVREYVLPTQNSVTEIKNSIVSLTGEMKHLAEQLLTVFAAHNAFLEEKRKASEKESEENTPLGLVKKYAPVVVFLVAVVALFRVLGTVFETWVQHIK